VPLLAAMFEIDPYLEIECFPSGVQPETVDEFLTGQGGRIDLLVEECDDLAVKVVVRERARAHRIPVIMDTSDRGLLDIERFDLEPDRPLFHGLIGAVRADELRGLETKDKVPFFLSIVDEERMSLRMAASLPEIKQTISSWPQLASSVALGGAVAADAARRILLGEHRESGRYYLDPSTIVADGQATMRQPVPPPRPFEIAPEASRPPVLPDEPAAGSGLTPDVVRWMAAMGTLAPSAHNAQPWRLVWRASARVLECHHDPGRDLPSLDFQHGATWVAFGALAENVSIAASHLGAVTQVLTWPEPGVPDLVCRIGFLPAPSAQTDPLLPLVTKRVTNRRRDGRQPLPAGVAQALAAACEGAGARLQIIECDAALDEIGALMGACDRISLLNQAIHSDATHGYRWTPEEVRTHPHGLDVATLSLTASERAGLRLMQRWRTMECLGRIGGGRALEELATKLIASASAVGLLTVKGTSREDYFQGGRALQRMWLTGTGLGVALQPITGLPYLFARLERGGAELFAPHERTELGSLREQYSRLFETRAERAEVLLFRLLVAEPPTARSLRRPLDDVLTFEIA
jgi:nitroreductase